MSRIPESEMLVERARLAGMVTDATSRASLLREAHRLLTEICATGHAERVAKLLAESLR